MKKVALLVAIMVLSGLNAVYAAEMINGAGATFPYPLYSKWFYNYEKQSGTKINYASIGSGGGISQVKAGTVDFGATDSPLKAAELAEAGLFQFPMVAGSVAVIYNVPGAPDGLKLDSRTVADMYLGKIKMWNDPAIAKNNPGVSLPAIPVIVTHRSDGSGTTNIFTWYLEDVSPEWKARVGSGKAVNWPVGLGGKGNEGVAGIVKQTRGALGYVEVAFAEQNKMSFASLSNKDGKFVKPTIETESAAAAGANVPADYYTRLTFGPGANSYPVTGFTYLLVKKNHPNKAKVSEIKKLIKWAYVKGDSDAKGLHYIPLPEKLKARVLADMEKQVR